MSAEVRLTGVGETQDASQHDFCRHDEKKEDEKLMNEVNKPKKPLIFYYGIALLIILLYNLIAVPWMLERQIKEVDYGTFMSMTEHNQIGQVNIQSNQILFTDKDNKQVYKTGLMDNPDWLTVCTVRTLFFPAKSLNRPRLC